MTSSTASAAPSAAPARRVWPALVVLTAATFWTVTAEMLPAALLASMSRDLDVTEPTVGLLVSVWAVTIAVVGVPLVRLTLRVPRAVLLTASLAVTAPANLVTALAPDVTVALAGRVVAASAHGLFWALVVSYVATAVGPERVGRALSLVLAGPTLAGLAGLPLAALVAVHTGWRSVFAGLSGCLALTAIALGLVLLRSSRDGRPTEVEPGSWDRSAPAVVHVAAGGGLVLVGHFATFTYVTALVTDHSGLGADAIPRVLLVLGLTGAAGVAVAGVTADRLPRSSLVVASGLLAAGLALVLLGGGLPAVFVTGAVVWGLAIGALPPLLQARVLRVSSTGFRPLAGGVVVTALNLGVAGGAALGGVLLGHGTTPLLVGALLAATAGTLTLTAQASAGRTTAPS